MPERKDLTSSVANFYAGQKILVTGGTGFMGKVLVEKILRSCPDIDTIYLIIRSKYGKSVEQRWKEMTDLPLFDKLKSIYPDNLKKVKLFPGNLSEEDAGLSNEDKQTLVDNVTMVFHIAADVQFSESINDALIHNVKATKTFLDFALNMKKLKVFEYLSTAYSNFNLPPGAAVEKILPAPQDWRALLRLQQTEPETLQLLKEKLLCGHPNPYTWSKSLAEQVVNEYSHHFPTVIIRPAIVMGCVRDDPLKGWVDSLGGLNLVIFAATLGLMRVMKTSPDCYSDLISVDTVTRAEIVAAKKTAETKSRLEIYNCGTSLLRPVSYGEMMSFCVPLREELIVKEIFWLPHIDFVPNDFLFSVKFFLKQVVPAVLVDLILKCLGKKTRFMKFVKRASNANRVYGRFMKNRVAFPLDNYKKLSEYVHEYEEKVFSPDDSDIMQAERRDEVLTAVCSGVLKYLAKSDFSEEAHKEALQRYKKLELLDSLATYVQYISFGFLSWYALTYVSAQRNYILK